MDVKILEKVSGINGSLILVGTGLKGECETLTILQDKDGIKTVVDVNKSEILQIDIKEIKGKDGNIYNIVIRNSSMGMPFRHNLPVFKNLFDKICKQI